MRMTRNEVRGCQTDEIVLTLIRFSVRLIDFLIIVILSSGLSTTQPSIARAKSTLICCCLWGDLIASVLDEKRGMPSWTFVLAQKGESERTSRPDSPDRYRSLLVTIDISKTIQKLL
jgi:hypothetical protein